MMKKHGIQDPPTFTDMERVAARIGDGGLDVGFYLSNTDSLHARAYRLFGQSLAQVNRRVLLANDMDCIMDGEMPVEELGIPIEAIPEQMSATVGTQYGEFVGAMHLVSNAGESPEVYYYHGDHLGSASWITDSAGTAVQHLQYLPFGERFVDQRTSGYCERFTFTGKERDEETGFGYFGARYLDYELMAMWLSVDPLADKYPGISPYAYCAWNPLKQIDPDGREMGDFYSKDGTYLNTDGNNDGKVYIVKDQAWGTKIKNDRLSGKNTTLDLDKVERFTDENGNDLFLAEDIIKKISSAENLSSDGNEHGFFYRKKNETPERELESFPDHLTFNKYPDLWLSMHTHPQEQDATMSEQDHADMDQIPINIVIGNNKPSESGNVKSTNFPTYRVVNFYRHEEPAFSMNMTCINKMVKRINNKNK